MKHLVFIHGRSQQGKDSAQLKRDWIDAWREGLAKSGFDIPIDEANIHFPYYGDTLQQMVDGVSATDAAKIIVRGAEDNPEAAFLMDAILSQYVTALDIKDAEIRSALDPAHRKVVERGVQNWPWVQAILRVIDQRVPGAGALVALVTYDVYLYLTNRGLRDYIEAGVSQGIHPEEENIFVTHSLGTIVGYTLLNLPNFSDVCVPLMVTLGSPLGIEAIREKLKPIKNPPSVAKWFNARDPNDVVALYPLDNTNFPIVPSIENKNDVKNRTDNKHGIVGYLDDKEVARRIYDALS